MHFDSSNHEHPRVAQSITRCELLDADDAAQRRRHLERTQRPRWESLSGVQAPLLVPRWAKAPETQEGKVLELFRLWSGQRAFDAESIVWELEQLGVTVPRPSVNAVLHKLWRHRELNRIETGWYALSGAR